ncbi:MAG TPA: hypothetical protein V6C58_10155 [Allocoleopsis sp.]
MTNVSKKTLECIREVSNFSKIELTDRFDKPSFDPEKFLNNMILKSPKLVALLNKIEELDRTSYSKEKKLYKHFIFSDLKKGYGAKIIASSLLATGYSLILKKQGSKVVVDQEALNEKNEAKFAVLSSTALWDTQSNPKLTKEILNIFNKRPDNTYGENVRIIVLDSGFKEGIDLFDVRYVHVFEEQMTQADYTQAVGRALRFCGQKGLPFKNGWKIDVFNYKLYEPIKKFKILEEKKVIIEHYLKANEQLKFNNNFQEDLTNLIQESSVDNELNKNINKSVKYGFFDTVRKYIVPITFLGTFIISTAFTYRKIKQRKKSK